MRGIGCLALTAYAGAQVAAQEIEPARARGALELDDECAEGAEQCSVSAIQMRGQKSQAHASEADASVHRSSGQAEGGQWPWWGTTPGGWGGGWGTSAGSHTWAQPAWWSTWTNPSAPSPSAMQPPAPVPVTTSQCHSLDSPTNANCKEPIEWVANKGGKYDPSAASWFEDMKKITGVDYMDATVNDFQRMYYCSPPGGKACGSPPCTCTKPPCNTCFGGAPPKKPRPECQRGEQTIACVPPRNPLDYNGMAWTTLSFPGQQQMHIFAIGDWGGMDGSLNPIEGRTKLMAYSWGARKGPSVFPRTRWNRYHTVELCDHESFTKCYDSHGTECPSSCGYVKEIDEQPQQLVAKAMADRARLNPPQYILNVGDNFYWGGIEKTCGTPMSEIAFTTHHQFDQIFEQVYGGLGEAPWLSVLGNHDWGGRQFNNGWDQQIAYTWASNKWVMPAAYYMVRVEYPDQMFSVEFFMLDTNFLDAKDPSEDPEHNICGPHNPAGADCSSVGGPSSMYTCNSFFQTLWYNQKSWIASKLAMSRATWQIAVTHFPCGQDGAQGAFYRQLRGQGLDLLVTGHRHDQELWRATDGHNYMAGLSCFVTGGGGGISSEATPDPNNRQDWFGEAQYGFFDLTITKSTIYVESINWDGTVAKSDTVYPK